MPRSSIAKTPLRLCNSIGLIDGGYRGEIMAAVDNIKGEDYTVEPNQRLFQLVAMNGSPISFEIVNDYPNHHEVKVVLEVLENNF